MRTIQTAILLIVLVSTCVQSQPRGRGRPGPPPPEAPPGQKPGGGPGPPPADVQGQPPTDPQGPQAFSGPGAGPPVGQSPPQQSPPGQSANPWQDLLTKMMDLLSTGSGPKNLSKVPAEIIDPKQGPGSGPARGSAPGDVPPPPRPLHLAPKEPVIKDCFWENQYYTPGSDIVRGQHDRWCYVTYCDNTGKIQFWDDYNCPPNSMRDTSSHSAGRDRWVPPGQRSAGGPPRKQNGCDHGGQWYEANQDISSHRVGERCYGSYCSPESQVVNWEDWCTNVNNVGATPSPGHAQKPSGGFGQGQPPRRGGQGRRPGQGQGRGRQGQRQGGGRRAKPTMGCYHGGKQYTFNEDVIVGTIGDLCYGYYCEGDNVFVHWEDSCQNQNIAPPAPATAPPPIQQTTRSWWMF